MKKQMKYYIDAGCEQHTSKGGMIHYRKFGVKVRPLLTLLKPQSWDFETQEVVNKFMGEYVGTDPLHIPEEELKSIVKNIIETKGEEWCTDLPNLHIKGLDHLIDWSGVDRSLLLDPVNEKRIRKYKTYLEKYGYKVTAL